VLLVLPLGDDPAVALRALGALAALAERPHHHVVVVAPDAPALSPLLAGLDGDVTILRGRAADGPAVAWAAALDVPVDADDALLLAGPVAPAAGVLAAVLATLDDGAHGALVPAGQPGRWAGVAGDRRALRAAIEAGGPSPASAPEALAAVALRLAADGPVRPAATPPAPWLAPDASSAATRSAAARPADAGHAVPAAAAEPVRGDASAPASPLLGRRDARARDGRHPGGEPELTIVVPTLDATGERLRSCVAALQRHTDAPHEIVIVDNGAPPQGFTAPVNAGLRAARGRHVVVCNDDVHVLEGWWAPLRAALDDGASIAFPLTVEGGMRDDFAAWCFGLSRATLDRFAVAPGEFLHPELRVWFQDTDLLLRLRAAGVPPRLVRESRIAHGLSETVATADPTLRAWIDRQIEADRERFAALHPAAVEVAA